MSMVINSNGQVEYADNDDSKRCLNDCGCVAIQGDFCSDVCKVKYDEEHG